LQLIIVSDTTGVISHSVVQWSGNPLKAGYAELTNLPNIQVSGPSIAQSVLAVVRALALN